MHLEKLRDYYIYKDISVNKMFYSLLRTIPTLSGNVKIACNLSDYIESEENESGKTIKYFDCYCRYARLLPLSSSLYQKNIKANLLGSSYDYDLKTFYTYYKDVFYKNNFSYNTKDLENIDKTTSQYQRNTDLEFGVKRISYMKNNAQFAFFAPIYITSSKDIPQSFIISCKFVSGAYSITKKIRVNLSSNITYKGNYLYKYLNKYVSKIDDNVIFMKPITKQATYYGIDLLNGGLVQGYDNIIGDLYKKQHTINSFDSLINYGFSRNNMAMRQILPLCYLFNPLNLLSNYEKKRYSNASIQFSGYYINAKGTIQPLSDFYIDYDELSQNILEFNENTCNLVQKKGKIDNIMDYSFPSLNEARISNYQFSSKLSPMYNRWKLKFSDDKYPYITNMSFAFSKNQGSNYNYREFISKYSPIPICGNIINIEDTNKYNILLPVSKNKTIYKDYNSNIIDSYKNIINNYCMNWFDISTMESDYGWIDDIEWADIKDNYCYYRGILYNLNEVYNYLKEGYEKIDKFAIIVKPIYKTIDSESIKNIYTSNYTILKRSSSVLGNGNCSTNPDFIQNQTGTYNDINDGSANTKSLYNWIYENESEINTNTDTIKPNMMFKYYGDNINDDKSKYIYTRLSYLGIEYNKVNRYFTYDAITDLLKGFDSALNTYTYIQNKYENKDIISQSLDIFKTNINDVNRLYSEDDYIKGYKILENNIAYLISSSSIETNTFNLVLPEYTAYQSITYLLYNCQYNKNDEGEIKVIIPSSIDPNYIVRNVDNSIQYVYPGYADPNEGREIIIKDDRVTWYVPTTISDPNDFTYYSDPIYTYFRISEVSDFSKKDNSIKNTIHSYIYISNNENSTILNTTYNYSLYIEDKLIRSSSIHRIAYNDYNSDILQATYVKYPSKVNEILECTNYIKSYFGYYMYNSLEHIDEYEYCPVAFNGNNIYAKSFFKKHISDFYGNIINVNNIKKDKDVIWLDIYNMVNVCNLYNIDFEKKLSNKYNLWENAYINFLNKDHIYYWYYDIHKNPYKKDIYTNWYDDEWKNHIFVKYRKLVNIDNNKDIEIKDKIIPLTEFIKTLNIEDVPFYTLYSNIVYNEDMDIFYIKGHSENKFELLFSTTLIRLDDEIYENIISISKESNKYKDLYLYIIQDTKTYENKIINIEGYAKINYEPYNEYKKNVENGILYLDPNNVLRPLFYNIFEQNKKDESLWVQYQLNAISEVSITNGTKNYRYDKNPIDYMIELTEKEINEYTKEYNNQELWEIITGKKFETILYALYNITQAQLSNKYNELNYYDNMVSDSLCTVKQNGINYGFYLIEYTFDNTGNTFEIYINEYKNGKLINTHNNINLIEYYNRHNIIANPNYLVNDFRLLLPFMKYSLTDLISNISSFVKPHTFYIENRYSTQLVDNTNNSKELQLINDNSQNTNQVFLRYMNYIMPAFHNTTTITNQYNLKFKDTNNTILDKGTFNSIGDSPIYASDISINEYHPLQVYTHDNNFLVKDYNNISFKFTPLEYKHYNTSKGINLSTKLEYKAAKTYTYNELLNQETEESTIKVFRYLIAKTSINKFTNDEILFLYNKYKHSYSSVCVGLNSVLKEKMYSLKYIFELY